MASYIPGLEYWDLAAYNATIVDGFGEFVELHVQSIRIR